MPSADETLIALLAPRGVLSKYRYPLSYAGAITKYFVKFKSKSRILGDENSIPSGGGVPEGRWGSLTPMSGDGSIFIPLSTPQPLSEPPRDEQPIRSVLEHNEQLDRACLNTTKPSSECYLVRRLFTMLYFYFLSALDSGKAHFCAFPQKQHGRQVMPSVLLFYLMLPKTMVWRQNRTVMRK